MTGHEAAESLMNESTIRAFRELRQALQEAFAADDSDYVKSSAEDVISRGRERIAAKKSRKHRSEN